MARVLRLLSLAVGGCLLAAAARPMYCQESAPAPIPSAISAAKNVFIANAGSGYKVSSMYRSAGGVREKHYNSFYAAMQQWGRYQLVTSPAEADLVMEISAEAPISDVGGTSTGGPMTSVQPILTLRLYDAKTHFLLWSLEAEFSDAVRKPTFDKKFDEGIADLMSQLKELAAPPARAR